MLHLPYLFSGQTLALSMCTSIPENSSRGSIKHRGGVCKDGSSRELMPVCQRLVPPVPNCIALLSTHPPLREDSEYASPAVSTPEGRLPSLQMCVLDGASEP